VRFRCRRCADERRFVWALLAARFGGTILACSLLQFAYWRNPAIGLIVAAVMALFQLGLLLFLYFA
jgi:hypothetical protein